MSVFQQFLNRPRATPSVDRSAGGDVPINKRLNNQFNSVFTKALEHASKGRKFSDLIGFSQGESQALRGELPRWSKGGDFDGNAMKYALENTNKHEQKPNRALSNNWFNVNSVPNRKDFF